MTEDVRIKVKYCYSICFLDDPHGGKNLYPKLARVWMKKYWSHSSRSSWPFSGKNPWVLFCQGSPPFTGTFLLALTSSNFIMSFSAKSQPSSLLEQRTKIIDHHGPRHSPPVVILLRPCHHTGREIQLTTSGCRNQGLEKLSDFPKLICDFKPIVFWFSYCTLFHHPQNTKHLTNEL